MHQALLLTFDGARRLVPGLKPEVVVVDFDAGADRRKVESTLAELGFTVKLSKSALREFRLSLRGAALVPEWLGAFMAVLAAGVLVHLVTTAVRRRTRELATLRALGFARRQVRATVTIQVALITLIAVAVGVIAGTLGGRATWRAYAKHVGVVPAPVYTWGAVVGVAATTVLVGAAAALLAADRVARRTPASTLRAE
jgi:ABC-type antimicrobial peptide transport system permease subunit